MRTVPHIGTHTPLLLAVVVVEEPVSHHPRVLSGQVDLVAAARHGMMGSG
jgi:hypothetical protein